jgi:hypothetical protein
VEPITNFVPSDFLDHTKSSSSSNSRAKFKTYSARRSNHTRQSQQSEVGKTQHSVQSSSSKASDLVFEFPGESDHSNIFSSDSSQTDENSPFSLNVTFIPLSDSRKLPKYDASDKSSLSYRTETEESVSSSTSTSSGKILIIKFIFIKFLYI